MDAERLERAARALLAHMDGWGPSAMGEFRALKEELRAAMNAAKEPAQAGEAVAWQIVDHNYGPTHYFGMTEDDAWARMVKASGEGRSVWARTRFARPLYAAPSRPGGASRADALKEAEEACKKVARDAAESGLSRPFNFVDGAYHAAEAVSALAGRGA